MTVHGIVVVAGLIAATSLTAQATFVVDAANGPGTNFTEINTAAATVPSGSILLVRAGNYAAVTIQAKALTVLCEPNVQAGSLFSLQTYLTVTNTTAAQHVVVRGLWSRSWGPVVVNSAAGPVLLDGAGVYGGLIRVANSSQVLVRSYTFGGFPTFNFGQPTAQVTANSSVVFESCELSGSSASIDPTWGTSTPAYAALEIGLDQTPCRVQLAHCNVHGGGGATNPFFGVVVSGQPAVRLDGGSSLRALGTAAHVIQAGGSPSLPGYPPQPAPAVSGNGIARIDAQIVLVPPSTSTTSLPISLAVMPSIVSSFDPASSLVTVERFGATGIPVALAVAFPGPPTPWFTELDPLWLDPATALVVAFGVPPTSPLPVQWQVPNAASLFGATIVWQAADFEPNGGLPLSNPSAVVVR